MKKSLADYLQKGNISNITTYQAGILQSVVNRTLQKHSDTILRKYGLTKMHWLILGSILDAQNKGVRITDLAKTLGTTLPYLTTTINLLESKGMVARANHETDSRAKLVVIDPAFAERCQEIESAMRTALRKTIYANVDPEDFHTYMKVLYQLSQMQESY
jgi:DNA-binding MarR family transcriptional regulator